MKRNLVSSGPFALLLALSAVALPGCPRSSQGDVADQKAVAPSVIAVASAPPSVVPTLPSADPARPVTGYYYFTPPRSWIEVGPRAMTMQELRYELPRPTGKEPVVALEHRRITSAHGSTEEVIEAWKKRVGTSAARSITERTQPILRQPDGGVVGEARVVLFEHVQKGRAALAALVDLSSVDARTRSAYSRVAAAYFEIEGPEAMVRAARVELDSMVRSVTIGD